MRTKHVALQEELEKYGACDPVKIEEKRRAIVLAREAAIRWTGGLCFRNMDALYADGCSHRKL